MPTFSGPDSAYYMCHFGNFTIQRGSPNANFFNHGI